MTIALIGATCFAAGLLLSGVAALIYRKRCRQLRRDLEQVAVLLRPQAD